MKLTAPYFGSLLAFIVIDFVWLGLIMAGFYREQLGFILAENFNLFVAGIFYFIYTAGVFIFAVLPSVREGKWQRAALLGSLLGFVAYATYDLSNLATLKGWPVIVVLVDIVWGSLLTSITAVTGFVLVKLYNRPKKI